jgi:hypothetical protein
MLSTAVDEFEAVKGPLQCVGGEYFNLSKKNKRIKHFFGFYRSKNTFAGEYSVLLVLEKISFVQVSSVSFYFMIYNCAVGFYSR